MGHWIAFALFLMACSPRVEGPLSSAPKAEISPTPTAAPQLVLQTSSGFLCVQQGAGQLILAPGTAGAALFENLGGAIAGCSILGGAVSPVISIAADCTLTLDRSVAENVYAPFQMVATNAAGSSTMITRIEVRASLGSCLSR